MEKQKTSFKLMIEVLQVDYLKALSEGIRAEIHGNMFSLRGKRFAERTGPPTSYRCETTTVWSFPGRGDWATHQGDYRGNWSPYVPRNLLVRYTSPGQWVLDPMMGSGTTLAECKILGRNAIGIDVNRDAVLLAQDRLAFRLSNQLDDRITIRTFVGDARNLDLICDESIDLVTLHPPYWNIVKYSQGTIEGDLSNDGSLWQYLENMGRVASECYRVLKKDKRCAIMIGDTRIRRHMILISTGVLRKFIEAGFVLEEDIVKVQHNAASEQKNYGTATRPFFRIAHEHLYVLRRPRDRSELQTLRPGLLAIDGTLGTPEVSADLPVPLQSATS